MTTTDRDLAHSIDHSTPSSPEGHDLVPGRTTRTDRLDGPGGVRLSGIVQRKAERGGDGLTADAATAVDAASSSSGQALPSGLARDFGASLGADLSGVRVHTGSASAAAASAVSARAFATGSDIHFAAGQYAPETDGGKHLLAHEVAHTVQQSGGAAGRAQFKLEVSSPGDALEHEADRAADAMISGRTASVSATAGLARQFVQRDYRTDADKAGDEAATQEQHSAPDAVAQISDVKDKEAAEHLLKLITGWQGEMSGVYTYTKNGEVTSISTVDLETNEHAVMKLERFVGSQGAQEVATGNFKGLWKRAQIQGAKLDAMAKKAGGVGIQQKNDMAGEDGQPQQSDSEGIGTDLAKDHLAIGAGVTAESLAARAQALTAAGGVAHNLAPQLLKLQEDKAGLKPQGDLVVAAEAKSTHAVQAITTANTELAALGGQLKAQSLKAEFTKAKAEIEENQKMVGEVAEIIVGAGAACMGEEATAGKVAMDVGADLAKKLASKLGTIAGSVGLMPGTLSLSKEDEDKGQEADVKADKAQIDAYTAKKDAIRDAANKAKDEAQSMLAALAVFDQKKKEYRTSLISLGTALDAAERKGKKKKPGEMGPFELVTTFIAEADTYIAQADMAIKVGEQERSSTSGSAANTLRNDRGDVDSFSVAIPGTPFTQPDGKKVINIAQQTLHLVIPTVADEGEGGGAGGGTGSMSGPGGGYDTIEQAISELKTCQTQIQAYREQMAKALGC